MRIAGISTRDPLRILLILLLGVCVLLAMRSPPSVLAASPAPTEEPGTPQAPSGEAGVFAIQPDQIRLDTQDLPYTWQAVVVPGTPYDESMPPGPVGLPTHIEILFGASDPAGVNPGDPIMYIIPVNTYRKQWDDAGNPAVTKAIGEIDQLTVMMPNPPPTSGLPALPFEQTGGYNDLAAQVGRVIPYGKLNTTAATQDGYRFVGRWAQDANPVTNQGLRYVYQGFTNDGVYLVSFWHPVSTATLPNDVSEVPADQMEQFNADPSAHTDSAAEMLNGLSPDQWEPDLSTLDALVASLEIEGMVIAGLVDKTWEWVEGPAQPGSSEIVTIEEPSLYMVTYGSDGTITYVADCNSGTMSYELRDGGTIGGMLAQPGPVTLAECGPDSLSQGFVYTLQAAQDYRTEAGGNTMVLVLPAGGGFPVFREKEAATVTGTITFGEDAALPAGAVVTVQIQDVSMADAPAKTIGTQEIHAGGKQGPIPYEVAYDPRDIDGRFDYSVSVRIEDGEGNLLFISDTHVPVITRGNPTEDVEISVVPVGSG